MELQFGLRAFGARFRNLALEPVIAPGHAQYGGTGVAGSQAEAGVVLPALALAQRIGVAADKLALAS
jgi:hypothetical protein